MTSPLESPISLDHVLEPACLGPTGTLGSQYGTCGGRAAYARETTVGSWQIKIHEPTNRLAHYDGWLLIGIGWPTLADACAATGMSYR